MGSLVLGVERGTVGSRRRPLQLGSAVPAFSFVLPILPHPRAGPRITDFSSLQLYKPPWHADNCVVTACLREVGELAPFQVHGITSLTPPH